MWRTGTGAGRQPDNHFTLWALAVVLAAVLTADVAHPGHSAYGKMRPAAIEAGSAQPDAEAIDGMIFPVNRLIPRYPMEDDFGLIPMVDHPQLPPAERLLNVEVELYRTDEGLIGPYEIDDQGNFVIEDGERVLRWPDHEPLRYRLADFNDGVERDFASTAILEIVRRVRQYFTERDYVGVYVQVNPEQIDQQLRDRRDPDDLTIELLMIIGAVTELRTVASGDRIDEEERINHPEHERIRLRSPYKPHDPDVEPHEERRDVLSRQGLNEYMWYLGRHPGRRVDASIGPGEEPGGIALDYLVAENRPALWYFETSNTGTRQTGRWRQRFGLMHTQLTGNDDILNLEYVTTNFEDVHGVSASYEAPFMDNDRLRWRVFGGYSRYTASEVGIFDDRFKGRSWAAGADLRYNFLQHNELFLDAVAGLRFSNIRVNNEAVQIQGEEQFLFPYVGLRLEREAEWFRTLGSLTLEYQNGSFTSTDEEELNRLGRLDPDRNWATLRWDLNHAFFLEPLFNPDALDRPDPEQNPTLAHELTLGARGQYSFDRRLIPQSQQVVGGFHTVRGYPESIVAGDDVIIGNVEYRFHVPRAFGVEAEPRELFGQPFRFAPQYTYGRPDWDLILRAFVDVGRSMNNDRFFFESNETLIGAGIGVEFQVKRNLSARLDWGFALSDVDRADVESGDNRVHFIGTLAY